MKDACDILTVTFESGVHEEAGLCVGRKVGDHIVVLKTEVGEQADTLHYLLTEQTAKAEIRKRGHWIYKQYGGYPECGNWHCSECDVIDNCFTAYCSHCGAKMVEPQERRNA